MAHGYERYNDFLWHEWTHNLFVLSEGMIWKNLNQKLTCTFVNEPDARFDGESTVSFMIQKGALWSNDSFEAGERVCLFYKLTPDAVNCSAEVCLIISEKVYWKLTAGKRNCLGMDVGKIYLLMRMPADEQEHALAYISGEQKKTGKRNVCKNINPADTNGYYYEIVKDFMLPEQIKAFEGWEKTLSTSRNIHTKIKMNYLLSISPNALDYNKNKVSYKSIMQVFNQKIEGFTELKEMIAKSLAERHSLSANRGSRILIHGLPGTGLTLWGTTIAEALNISLITVNLKGISSTIAIRGCETAYENAEPGSILKAFYAEKTSEVVLLIEGCDTLAEIGSDRGKDGNVAEAVQSLSDPVCPVLRDAYMDNVPIDCSNTIFIFTGNSDAIPEGIKDNCELNIEIPAFSENDILEILKRHLPALQKEFSLPEAFISDSALQTSLLYRGDFGARDAIANLRMIASHMKNDERMTQADDSYVCAVLSQTVNMNNSTVRFHYNEARYPEKQRKEIIRSLIRRLTLANHSKEEKRALDLRIDYLTKLIPDGPHPFDAEVFYKEADQKLYGMKDAKDRIAAELFAASMGSCKSKSVNLLLVGGYGVGKSSLMKAVAASTGRKIIHLQMNAITNSSFLKGHFKEYTPSDAGQPVIKMAEAQTTEPLFYLDEFDKMSAGCESALFDFTDDARLFYDNFLEMQLDLSGAMIIASANDLSQINPGLVSRFKVVYVQGYTAKEKKTIAKDFLLPELLNTGTIKMEEEAFSLVLSHYETDGGIRNMKQAFETIIHQAMLQNRYSKEEVLIRKEEVNQVLGAKPYTYIAGKNPGCVNGLAVCDNTGMVMPIKCSVLHSGEKRVTGMAEESIRESILLAETWLERRFGFSTKDGFHIHFAPAGIKKEGASAGAAVAVALLSALTETPVASVGITGEFDGDDILPVGGLHHKIQAAQSAGIRTVYVPEANRTEIDRKLFDDIKIVFVSQMEEIIAYLFPNLSLLTMNREK